MALSQIKALLAVIERGSFTEAANSLYLTQTALGHRISTLETDLNFELFIRQRGVREVKLTEKGAKFVVIANQIVDLWSQALEIANEEAQSEIHISCGFSLYSFIVPHMLSCIADEGYTPNISSSNTKTVVHLMELGSIDFAFCGNDSIINKNTCMVDNLATEALVLLSRSDSPYSEHITVKDLDPREEVWIEWNSAYKNWHHKMFGGTVAPSAIFENVQQIAKIISNSPKAWAIFPAGIANYYAKQGNYKLSYFEEKLPVRNIVLLSKLPVNTKCHDLLIKASKASLAKTPGFKVANSAR